MKVKELKPKKRKKSVKTHEPKKDNEFFGNQEIKQNLKSFYDKEAKKYAETRKKFWHEEKVILDAISPLFEKEPPFDKGGAEHSEAEGYNQKLKNIPPLSPLTKGGHEKRLRVLEF